MSSAAVAPPRVETAIDVREAYDFGAKLGVGSFSVVFSGTHKRTQQQVAIKVVDKRKLDARTLRSVRVEAQILQNCEHENIVRLYEVFENDAFIYLVMELLTGGELFDDIVAKERYTEREASAVISTVTRAIDYLHQRGFVHRDLKPENLIYSSKGPERKLKLVDFGLARIVSAAKPTMETPCGTVGYCAPEVISDTSYDKSVDFWSIGVLTYILLSGSPPFYAENDTRLCEVIRAGAYSFDYDVWDKVSKHAKDLIRHLLELSARDRYGASQVLEHRWIRANTKTTPLETPRALEANRRSKGFQRSMQLATDLLRITLDDTAPNLSLGAAPAAGAKGLWTRRRG